MEQMHCKAGGLCKISIVLMMKFIVPLRIIIDYPRIIKVFFTDSIPRKSRRHTKILDCGIILMFMPFDLNYKCFEEEVMSIV